MKIENKHKLLCSKKVTVQRMGKLDWQKVFAKHIFYKGLVFRIYKISHNLVIKNQEIEFNKRQIF